MNRHELHECPRCGRPMVASYAFACMPGDRQAIPLGYACVNTECVVAERAAQQEREADAIRRAVQRGVVDP